MQSQFDFQRAQLNNDIESLGEQVDEVLKVAQSKQSQFDFQRAQLNKEIESLGEQVDELLKVAQ